MTNTKIEQIRKFLEILSGEVPKHRVLSTEEKPNGKFGEILHELDTDDKFIWYEDDWHEFIGGGPGTPGADGKTAYEHATEKGYEGTEEEFATLLAGLLPSEDIELINNKVTAWDSPTDDQYPSAKLVKETFDGIDVDDKEDKANKVTAWGSPTDEQYPSAKLVKDSLDGIDVGDKEDKSNKITRLSESSTDAQYPSAKAVYNEIQILKKASIIESWDMFSEVTQEGRAGDFVVPGDRFLCGVEFDGVYVPQIVEVLGIGQDETEGGSFNTVTFGFVDVLFEAMFDAPEPENEDSNRKNFGNNNWELSNIRQYLNSEDTPFVYEPQHDVDASPGTGGVYGGNGFLARLHPDLRNVIAPVKKWTSVPDIDGGGDVQTIEKVLLLSRKEINGGIEGTVGNEFVYQRYTNAANADRIKYLGNSANYWWQRSPRVSSSSHVRYVSSNGFANDYYSARHSYGVSPAWVIG